MAIAYCCEAVAVATSGGFADLQASAESCLTQAHVCAGDLEEAIAVGERALATFETRGPVWWACRTLWQLITAANARGEWRRGLEYCRRALEHGRAVDDLRLKIVGWCRTGSTHIQRGEPEMGLQCCEEALALAPIPFDTAMIKAVHGHGLVKIGHMEAGIAELTTAVAWFEQSPLHYTRLVFALRLGEAYLRQGERAQAHAAWRARRGGAGSGSHAAHAGLFRRVYSRRQGGNRAFAFPMRHRTL
jgi:tetratricopeptide (TPR) repeat protein